jgi:hypothetical protein
VKFWRFCCNHISSMPAFDLLCLHICGLFIAQFFSRCRVYHICWFVTQYFPLIGDGSIFVRKNGRVTVLCIHSWCTGHPLVWFYFCVTMYQVYCWKALAFACLALVSWFESPGWTHQQHQGPIWFIAEHCYTVD